MAWPDDVDGDVMRRLQNNNFDFDREVVIDFNIDFKTWPPSEKAMDALARVRSDALIKATEDEYVGICITARVTYDFVMSMQAELTKVAKPFGGWCDTWGVWTG